MFVFILVSLFLFCFTSVNSKSALDDTDHEEPYDFIDYRVLNAG